MEIASVPNAPNQQEFVLVASWVMVKGMATLHMLKELAEDVAGEESWERKEENGWEGKRNILHVFTSQGLNVVDFL